MDSIKICVFNTCDRQPPPQSSTCKKVEEKEPEKEEKEQEEERGVEEKHLMVRRPETTRLDKNYARQGGQPLPIGGSLDLVWVLPVNAKTILSYLNPSKNNNLLLRWATRNHINRNVVRIFLCIVLNFIAFLACTSDCSKLLLFAGHLPISRRRQHLATRLTKLPICDFVIL